THAKSPLTPGCLHDSFRARHLVDERLHLVGRTFLEKEGQNDSNRFLGHAPIHTNLGDKTIEKFVHGPTPSAALIGGLTQSLSPEPTNTMGLRRCWHVA